MIKTIQLDTMLTSCLGLLFALWRMEADNNAPFWRDAAYRTGLKYTYLVGVGIALTAYLVNPSWMWMYWVDPRAIPWWHMAVIFVIGYPALFTLGYLIGVELEKIGFGLIGFVLWFIVLLTVIVLTLGRLWKVSDYARYPGSYDPLIGFSPFHVSGMALVLIIGIPVALYGLYWSHKRITGRGDDLAVGAA